MDPYGNFTNYLDDPQKAPNVTGGWPHRSDSYILISAGVDGEYGTGDDITNFGR